MSNVLGPIVARYSLFFSLVLSDSSRLARSKHPRQVVQELVLQAQERFQSRYYANSAESKTLSRNVSTTSSSSNTTQYSLSSASSIASSASTRASSISSTCSNVNGSYRNMNSIPIKKREMIGDDCGGPTASLERLVVDSHHVTILPSPPPSPTSMYIAKETSILPGKSLMPITPTRTPSTSSSCSAAYDPSTHRAQSREDKIAQRRRHRQTSSVATLLSIALTVILLSLLQNRRHCLKKQNRQSHRRSLSAHHKHQLRQRHPILSSQLSQHRLSEHHHTSNRLIHTQEHQFFPVEASKENYVSTWLGHQGYYRNGNVSEQLPWDAVESREIFFSQNNRTVNATKPTGGQYSLQNHDDPSLLHFPRHRRALSMTNPNTSTATFQSHFSSNHGEYYHVTDPVFQMHQYRLHHFPYIDQRFQLVSAPPAVEPASFVYGPSMKSADELAWERHNYYQRLQQEEEELALKMLQEKGSPEDHVLPTSSSSRQRYSSQDYVVRAGSLNRLASPPLLSKETSRILGLCRSNTLSAAKRMSLTKKRPASRCSSSTTATSSIVSIESNDANMAPHAGACAENSIRTASRTGSTVEETTPTPAYTSVAPSLTRKKTLKEHLTPPLRSLARRCSARFTSNGSNNNGRPISFAGIRSDPIVDYPQGRRSLGSRASGSSISASTSASSSSHMCDFKPLQLGPETSEMLRQQSQQQEAPSVSSTPLPATEPVPVHRSVGLFRSKTTRPQGSASMVSGGSSAKHAETLPFHKKNSLRLANGRGLDFLTVLPSPSVEPNSRGSLNGLFNASESATLAESAVMNAEEHEAMRKEIIAMLSLGRKDLRRKPSTVPMSTSTPLPSPPQCLSPLALEAQEDLYSVQEHEQEEQEGQDQEDSTLYPLESDLQDPCKKIAFMLVPKSRYEFQPLVVQ
ncbi:hypothetical protein BX616_002305 [Lobosporangium transversale]|uniref:Uncharacterized protein n=1 Tax=Lobosporangium transversale TaxID=64571 RepID=A0A1Y2GQA2_9FUNG|nr:hypothetical protein BCR41DRAFT_354643 [Lobosporangium transversale]KAF9901308.1 hypothetical protein BX616_002305 [Lobosporangium transversale]ORZ14305.1 hypothetical protein BCR41DRAFT_354643 [Lobosporangium transversale]|eukprot:XP_021880783.1 hypothetical protein BCR41DRAFT_354643 [Lobosporangium transversale]